MAYRVRFKLNHKGNTQYVRTEKDIKEFSSKTTAQHKATAIKRAFPDSRIKIDKVKRK